MRGTRNAERGAAPAARVPFRASERGAAAIYIILLLAFVLFGFMVMAFDVGRLYAVQAELQAAADSAAMAAGQKLVGTANSALHGSESVAAGFDATTGNDNRFNLRLNQIGVSSELASEVVIDYFVRLEDALANLNGAQAGAEARYVRVQINAEAPVAFARFLSLDRSNRQLVSAVAVSGVSAPMCTACGIDPVAITALDTADELDYGFSQNEYYTLYLNLAQQRPNQRACPSQRPGPLDGTAAVAEYTILNHLATGPETELDGEIFRMGAGPMANTPGLDPAGCVSITAAELPKPDIQSTNCGQAIQVGRNFLCGLNTRFGVDAENNNCNSIEGVQDLALLFRPDTDLGTGTGALQDYATEYDGNSRRVITVPIVDASDTLTVLNFRQFLLQNSVGADGLTTTGFTGAVRAQYIGRAVPLRSGAMGGACTITAGIGRTVLH